MVGEKRSHECFKTHISPAETTAHYISKGSQLLLYLLSHDGGGWFSVSIINRFRGDILQAVESPNASLVIRKAVELLPPALVSFVAEEITPMVLKVARCPYGSCIVQYHTYHLLYD